MTVCSEPLDIIIVGAGIGGLTAAITCCRAHAPMNVTVLERCPEITTIGAGIQVPPNACRVLMELGLLEKIKQADGYEVGSFKLVRYTDGQLLAAKPLRDRAKREYNAQWITMHRGDYQRVLLEEAVVLGAKIITDAEVIDIVSTPEEQTTVILKDGRKLLGDVVIGADGVWSQTRNIIAGQPIQPDETGDLAYRATFSRQQLVSQDDEDLNSLLDQSDIRIWIGPDKHATFYPLRNHEEYNLVLVVADDLPPGVHTTRASIEEVVPKFDQWDPKLKKIILLCSETGLAKWKLFEINRLAQWTRDTTALLGDACHPTLPYTGQGAAMAVEDSATLGLLLCWYSAARTGTSRSQQNQQIARLLRLYHDMRKSRAALLGEGAAHAKYYNQLPDGAAQQARDAMLARLHVSNWDGPCEYEWGDAEYQRHLLAFDVFGHVAEATERWDKQSTAAPLGSEPSTGTLSESNSNAAQRAGDFVISN